MGKGDATSFLALIQLLMHAAEMVTPNQVQRLTENVYPEEEFKTESDDCPGYDLYLLMFGYEEHFCSKSESCKKLWGDLLEYTNQTVRNLVQDHVFFKYVRKIVCLNLPKGRAIEEGFDLVPLVLS